MPTPAVLSGQMDPPPIFPVVEMNFVTGEYELNQESTTMETLIRNGSGDTIDVVSGRGLALNDDISRTGAGIYPPSIRGTQSMIDAVAPLLQNDGGLTAVIEFDTDYEWMFDSYPYFLTIAKDDPFSADYSGSALEWHPEKTFSNPMSFFQEGYAYGHPTTSFNGYTGGGPLAGGGRRYRLAGTWGSPVTDAGVNNRRGAQSVNGTPQNVSVSFGSTPFDVDYDLSYLVPFHSIHIMSLGVDTASQETIDNGWWWWFTQGTYLRYFALYPVRPSFVLPVISRQPHQKVRVSQVYAEVIHDKVV